MSLHFMFPYVSLLQTNRRTIPYHSYLFWLYVLKLRGSSIDNSYIFIICVDGTVAVPTMRSTEAVCRVGAEAFGKRFSMILVALSLRKRAQQVALGCVEGHG